MNYSTSLVVTALVGSASLLFAQDAGMTHQFPEDAFATQELVAWSTLQTPQPVPQPMPPRDERVPQPGPQQSSVEANATGPAYQYFTGTIVKDGEDFVLKMAGNVSIRLDAENGIQKFENQSVILEGSFENGKPLPTISHIVKIE